METVSVVVPIYNVEPYLKKCMDSICGQTYRNLEIFCVYTESNDKTREILANYEGDNRVQVLIHNEGGLGGARNYGICHASGEWITFVDGDDWLDIQMIEELVSAVHITQADIGECGYYEVTDSETIVHAGSSDDFLQANSQDALLSMYQWGEFITVAWKKIYKTRIMKQLHYPENILHEDEFTTYKAYLAAERIVYVDQPRYYYNCLRNDSLSKKEYSEKNLVICQAYRERMHKIWSMKDVSEELLFVATSHYSWMVFDRLTKCWRQKIRGSQINRVIADALEDWKSIQINQYPIEERYLKAYPALEKGLKPAVRVWQGKKWYQFLN